MTLRNLPGLLTLAAAMLVALHAQAMELTLPGEPGADQVGEPECALAVPSDERLARGRVVAVDKAAGRITLEFQPILPFLPEGGKRIFHVEDAMSLKGLGPGDKVRFEVERDGRNYIVTRIENSN
jgi:Cu/Ag efflux protein CusF